MENLISFIIPFWDNDYVYIFHRIPKMLKEFKCCQYEVIFIDDRRNKEVNITQYIKNIDNVKLISNKENIGAFESRRAGVNIAEGKYTWFIDIDDIFSNFTEKQIEELKNNNFDILTNKTTLQEGKYKIFTGLCYNIFRTEFIKNIYLKLNEYKGFSSCEDYALAIVCNKFYESINPNFLVPYTACLNSLKVMLQRHCIPELNSPVPEIIKNFYGDTDYLQFSELYPQFNLFIKNIKGITKSLELTKEDYYTYIKNSTFKYKNQIKNFINKFAFS